MFLDNLKNACCCCRKVKSNNNNDSANKTNNEGNIQEAAQPTDTHQVAPVHHSQRQRRVSAISYKSCYSQADTIKSFRSVASSSGSMYLSTASRGHPRRPRLSSDTFNGDDYSGRDSFRSATSRIPDSYDTHSVFSNESFMSTTS